MGWGRPDDAFFGITVKFRASSSGAITPCRVTITLDEKNSKAMTRILFVNKTSSFYKNQAMEGARVQEVLYGPLSYGEGYDLPIGFTWMDGEEKIAAVRSRDKKIFIAERMIDVSHAWSVEDPRPPCTVAPQRRLILTGV